jgi:putative addiction module killer protein
MFEVRQTTVFDRWYHGLRDRRARARITLRLDRLRLGQFGDAKFLGGVAELRIDYGPGYRVYFCQRGGTIVLLLCGGDKTTQALDIAKARDLAREEWP